MSEVLANLATTTLSANMTSGALSCTVTSGAAFPSTGNFRVRIGSELIIVGGRSGNTLSSLTRGAEGSTAAAHVIGDLTKMVLTRDGLTTFVQENAGAITGILATLETMTQTNADALVATTATGRSLVQAADGAAVLGIAGAQAAATAATDAELTVAKRNAIESSKSGTYPLVAGDLGTTINATGALTITVPSGLATQVGDWFQVRRSTSSAVTINRGGSVEFFTPGSVVAKTTYTSEYVNQTLKFTCRALGATGVENDWVVQGVADPGLTKIYEAALDPDDFGASATPGFDNSTAFNNTSLAAKNAAANGFSSDIVIKQGKEYEFSDTWQFWNRVTLHRDGDLRYTGAQNWAKSALLFRNGTIGSTPIQGQEGGMVGPGRLYCARRVGFGVKVDCWRNGVFQNGVIHDPLDQAFYVMNGGVVAGNACDSNDFVDVRMAIDSTFTGWPSTDLKEAGGATVAADRRPKGFITFDGTPSAEAAVLANPQGNCLVTDSKVQGCFCAGGLFPESAVGANDGAWAVTLIDVQRIKFYENEWYSHWNRETTLNSDPTPKMQNLLWQGAYLLRSVTKDVSGNVFNDTYIEAAVQGGDGVSDAGAQWDTFKMILAITPADPNPSVAGDYTERQIQHNIARGTKASTSQPAANRRYVYMFNNDDNGAVGATGTNVRKIRLNQFLVPRGPYGFPLSDPGAIVLTTGCERNRFEVLSDEEAAGGSPNGPMWTVAGTARANSPATNRKNRIVSLSGGASASVA